MAVVNEMLTIEQDFSTPNMDRDKPGKKALNSTEEYVTKRREYLKATRNAQLSINPKEHVKVFSGREEWNYENI